MASRDLKLLSGLNQDEIRIAGSFRPNGATGIVANSQVGKGFSVVRSTVGKYLVTFDDSFPNLIEMDGGARSATGVATTVTGGVYTPANGATGAKATLELYVAQAGTNVDMAANADNVVNFEAAFGNASFV